MGVVDRLNALDEKAGIAGPGTPRAWEQSVRLWWVGPVGVVVAITGLTVLSAISGLLVGVWSALAFLPVTFWAGFFYNERLRALGRQPRYGRVPPGWPNDTT